MDNVAWVIASLIFVCFMGLFWRFGDEPIRSFAIRKRSELDELDEETKKFRDAFLNDFNGYLVSINRRNKFRYRIAAGGFFVAFLISLLLALSA